jgi:hypothetical protein
MNGSLSCLNNKKWGVSASLNTKNDDLMTALTGFF